MTFACFLDCPFLDSLALEDSHQFVRYVPNTEHVKPVKMFLLLLFIIIIKHCMGGVIYNHSKNLIRDLTFKVIYKVPNYPFEISLFYWSQIC